MRNCSRDFFPFTCQAGAGIEPNPASRALAIGARGRVSPDPTPTVQQGFPGTTRELATSGGLRLALGPLPMPTNYLWARAVSFCYIYGV